MSTIVSNVMIELSQARDLVRTQAAACAKTAVERVGLSEALGRVLAFDLQAPGDVPGFAHAAMDGYAVCARDLGAGDRLPLAGTSLAGAGAPPPLQPGTCVRIATGAPLPAGADTVVAQEDVRQEEGVAVFCTPITAGTHVRLADDDYAARQRALRAGSRVTAPALAVAAAFGHSELWVQQKPRVAVLVTGSELVEPGLPLGYAQRYNSNGALLLALLTQHGAQVIFYRHIADTVSEIRAAMQAAAAQADLLLCTGGASVGEADHVTALLDELGERVFWKVRMKPGMPTALARMGHLLAFALPGNPVSVFATFLLLVRPALAQLGRCADFDPSPWQARLLEPLHKSHQRVDFRRGLLVPQADGTLGVRVHLGTSSGALRSALESDVLVELGCAPRHYRAGDMVPIHWPLPHALRWPTA